MKRDAKKFFVKQDKFTENKESMMNYIWHDWEMRFMLWEQEFHRETLRKCEDKEGIALFPQQ